MAVKKKTPVTKNTVITRTIESSVGNLEAALAQAIAAVTARSAESKKLLNETRRLRKRRTSQMNRKKRAVEAEKKNATADTRKAARVAVSELAATTRLLAKTTASRQVVLQELSGLKQSQKALAAYVKAINAANRALAKPKRARRSVK